MVNISSSVSPVTLSVQVFSHPFIIIHIADSSRIWFQSKVFLQTGIFPSFSHWHLFSLLCFLLIFALAAKELGVIVHFNYSNFINLGFWWGKFLLWLTVAGGFKPSSVYQLQGDQEPLWNDRKNHLCVQLGTRGVSLAFIKISVTSTCPPKVRNHCSLDWLFILYFNGLTNSLVIICI